MWEQDPAGGSRLTSVEWIIGESGAEAPRVSVEGHFSGGFPKLEKLCAGHTREDCGTFHRQERIPLNFRESR